MIAKARVDKHIKAIPRMTGVWFFQNVLAAGNIVMAFHDRLHFTGPRKP